MSFSISSTVSDLEFESSSGTVRRVFLTLNLTGENGLANSSRGEFLFAAPPAENYTFIPYADLTEEIVKGLKDKITKKNKITLMVSKESPVSFSGFDTKYTKSEASDILGKKRGFLEIQKS